MKFMKSTALLCALMLLFSPALSEEDGSFSCAAYFECADSTSQIVLVEYEGNARASVSLHEKTDGTWSQVRKETGYVGKGGMGKRREGDKKTPTGDFSLSFPFGILDDPGSALPYTKVTEDHYWCASVNSEFYNQFVSAEETGRPAAYADEVLIRYKNYYNYCLFVGYNADGEKGKGSCIFLHCTGGKKSTSGCIAIDQDFMREILTRLRDDARIVLIESPADRARLQASALTAQSGSAVVVAYDKNARVHAAPDKASEVLYTPAADEILTFSGTIRLDFSGCIWYSVRCSGADGYISGDYALISKR